MLLCYNPVKSYSSEILFLIDSTNCEFLLSFCLKMMVFKHLFSTSIFLNFCCKRSTFSSNSLVFVCNSCSFNFFLILNLALAAVFLFFLSNNEACSASETNVDVDPGACAGVDTVEYEVAAAIRLFPYMLLLLLLLYTGAGVCVVDGLAY